MKTNAVQAGEAAVAQDEDDAYVLKRIRRQNQQYTPIDPKPSPTPNFVTNRPRADLISI